MSDHAKSRLISASTRCAHRFANGKRCRLLASPSQADAGGFAEDPRSRFCSLHASLPQNEPQRLDLSDELIEGLGDLNSPDAINEFLDRLLRLFAQDRVSTRRAAVFTYMAGQLLRSVCAMKEEQAQKSKSVRPRFIWTIPGPPREQDCPDPKS
jgi:hypothetical protein